MSGRTQKNGCGFFLLRVQLKNILPLFILKIKYLCKKTETMYKLSLTNQEFTTISYLVTQGVCMRFEDNRINDLLAAVKVRINALWPKLQNGEVLELTLDESEALTLSVWLQRYVFQKQYQKTLQHLKGRLIEVPTLQAAA